MEDEQEAGFHSISQKRDRSRCHFDPAICICDVMNEVRMCGKSIKYVTRNLFLHFVGKERLNTAPPRGGGCSGGGVYVPCIYSHASSKLP